MNKGKYLSFQQINRILGWQMGKGTKDITCRINRPMLLRINDGGVGSDENDKLQALLEANGWETSNISVGELGNENFRLFLTPSACLVDVRSMLPKAKETLEKLILRFSEWFIPIIIVVPTYESSLASFADETIEASVSADILLQKILRLKEKRVRFLDSLLVDPETGAFSSKYLQTEVERQQNNAGRTQEPFSIVYLSLDNLQEVVKKYGIIAGNELQREFVMFIRQNSRPLDAICRTRDGNFVLTLPHTTRQDALKFINRAMQSYRSKYSFSARIADGLSNLEDETVSDSAHRVQKINIAVIDDDRLVRNILSHQLSDLGGDDIETEVRAFSDGDQFFSDPWHHGNGKYIVIIDRVMPKMDGLETLQRIREGYDRRKYMCVMLTSRSSEKDIAVSIQKGANDYIVKPFSLKELKARLLRMVQVT